MGSSLSPIEEALSTGAAETPETHTDPSPPSTGESVEPTGSEDHSLPPEPGAPEEGETGTVETSEESEGVDDLEALPEERPLAEVTEPDDFKPAFKDHPELRDSWYAAQAYREVFGTVKEAQSVRDALPEGMSSLNEMQENLDRLSGLEEKFYSSETDGPDQFLAALYKEDHDAYSGVSNANFRNHLAHYLQQASSQNDEELSEAVKVLWQRSPATQETLLPGQQGPAATGAASQDPRLRNIEARERRLREQESRHKQEAQISFANRVQDEVDSHLNESILSHLNNTIGKRTSLGEGALNRMVSEIFDGVSGQIRNNAQLRRTIAQSVKSGDLGHKHASSLAEMLAKRSRQLVPGVAAKVAKDWSDTVLNRNKLRVKERETQAERVDLGGGGSPSAQSITGGGKPPDAKQIDYQKTTDDMILRDEYVLKDGTTVRIQPGA